MNHVDIINYLIEKYGYQSYLEIGLGTAESYLKVNCKHKECVDPYNDFLDGNSSNDVNEWVIKNILTHRMTSDEYFETIPTDKKFDIVFIDGLHMEEQTDKDILNSLKHLNPGGRLVIHDCLPIFERTQTPVDERPEGTWNGTTWKSIPKLALIGVNYVVVDTDQGCGIVEYTENAENLPLLGPADYDYQRVFGSEIVKRVIMRIISEDVFKILF